MVDDAMTLVVMGVQDVFSPGQIAVVGVLLALLMSLVQLKTADAVFFIAEFLLFLVGMNLFLDTAGMALTDFLPAGFIFVAAFFYGSLGLLFLLVALRLLVCWRLLLQDTGHVHVPWPRRIRIYPSTRGLLAFGLAGVLTLLARAWPPAPYVLWQGAMALTHGRLLDATGGLLVYELARHAGVVVVLVLVILAWRRGEHVPFFLSRHSSLVVIVLAACYLAASGALMYFFFNRG